MTTEQWPLTSPVQVDQPVMLATQSRAADNGALVAINIRAVDGRAVRAADETGLPAASIERLPFDLSVLDSGGVFIVRRATCG